MKVMNEGPVGFNGEQGQTQLATLIKWAAEQWVLSHWNHFWGLVATFTCQSGWTWWIGGTQEAGRANQLISHLSSLLKKEKEDYTFTVLHRVRLQKWECKCKAGSLCWLCRIYGKCKQWHVSLVETDSCVCHTMPAEEGRCHFVSVVILLTVVVSFNKFNSSQMCLFTFKAYSLSQPLKKINGAQIFPETEVEIKSLLCSRGTLKTVKK